MNRNIVIAIIVFQPFAIALRVGGGLAWRAGNMDGEIADLSLQKTAITAGRVRVRWVIAAVTGRVFDI